MPSVLKQMRCMLKMHLHGDLLELLTCLCDSLDCLFSPGTSRERIHTIPEDFLEHWMDEEPRYICLSIHLVFEQGVLAQQGNGPIER